MNYFTTFIAAGAVTFAAGAANAIAVGADNWGTTGTCDITDLDPMAVECFGLISATNDNTNNDQQIGKVDVNLDYFDDELGLFGETDWEFIVKYADGDGYSVGGGKATFSLLEGLVSSYGDIALGFKQGAGEGGSELAYYLYNDPFPASSMYSLAKFTNQGLSHLSIWGRGEADVCEEGDPKCDDPGTVVPLPAAGWLLIGGLGGLAALRRRKEV